MKEKLSQMKTWKYKNGILTVVVIRAYDVDKKDILSESDPFVRLELGGQVHNTSYKMDNKNPVWNETLELEVKDATREELTIEVLDYNEMSKNTKIGNTFRISVIDVIKKGGMIENWTMKVPGSKTTKLDLTLAYREST